MRCFGDTAVSHLLMFQGLTLIDDYHYTPWPCHTAGSSSSLNFQVLSSRPKCW